MQDNRIDIQENYIMSLDDELMRILLQDHSSDSNIIWATDNYSSLGEGYGFRDSITLSAVTGENGNVIKPRVKKSKEEQENRTKNKAEVFTPSWVCNAQNNLVDDAWFGKHMNRFNKELGTTWESTYMRKNPNDKRDRIKFPNKPGKTWQDYVLANRMEVSCGEAPYLTSRYDTVTGKYLKPKSRIGLLDRKLRVITENTNTAEEWLEWAEKALQSTYGFEWQGDNILLARENLFFTVIETFKAKYDGQSIGKEKLLHFAEIISWNIWQMDGIKGVIPESCHQVEIVEEQDQFSLFDNAPAEPVLTYQPCPGCKTGDKKKHNGIYAIIKDWREDKTVRFIDMMEGGENGKV